MSAMFCMFMAGVCLAAAVYANGWRMPSLARWALAVAGAVNLLSGALPT